MRNVFIPPLPSGNFQKTRLIEEKARTLVQSKWRGLMLHKYESELYLLNLKLDPLSDPAEKIPWFLVKDEIIRSKEIVS